jgi:hypothetical protein
MREPIRKSVNFRLPAGVLMALRKRAAKECVSMTTVVEAALREHLGVSSYLQRHAPKGGRP